jgi:hypothetical protein
MGSLIVQRGSIHVVQTVGMKIVFVPHINPRTIFVWIGMRLRRLEEIEISIL